ncbi:MAG: oligoendopeptidase F [Ignavibacteriae bacterium]|nr:oligoendopeptidase F [Ignavibacteriota bacterium]NOG99234.1 oligoendopeptidase F [Ignavibacteriota bacterium]
MHIKKLLLFLILLIFITSVNAQSKKRDEIDDKYKWDLSHLYPTVNDWETDYEKVSKFVGSIDDYRGKLGENAETFYEAMDLYFSLLKDYYKLVVYSNRLSDEDLGIAQFQELRQMSSSLGTKISEATSFIDPEILTIDQTKIDQFFEEKPELKDFKFYVEDIQRLKPHTLSDAEEKILASAGMLTDVTSNVYNIFNNAERINPTITLSTGEEVEVNAAGYYIHRASEAREDRKKIFEAMFSNYGNYENTLGANLAGKVKGDYFFAKNRKYNSSLEASLNANNIPVSVYHNLIEQVNKNLPTLHRALELKRKMLEVDTLHYYDLYTPIVQKVNMNFTVDEAQELLLDVLKPLGDEYVSTVNNSFKERWIDYYPSDGKRSGAYSSGAAYDEHPYILMNYTDDYESVSTLAHELGHTMHSYFSNKNQPFVNSGYATYVAEIASTLNENLLNNYMIEKVDTDKERLYLLGSYLELLRQTIFRQVSFAEFELAIHEKIENGEPLTGEKMSEIYADIVKKYYGHEKGVCVVDDYIKYEWSYIPHFLNYTYYVYQYSTSLIYATAFAEKIINEGQPAVDKYYHILKGGGSDYPINLIAKAGLDPLSNEAFNLTMDKMNRVIDQMEKIISKK